MSSELPKWHTLTGPIAANLLEVVPASGLGTAEAVRRLAEGGENRLAEPVPRPLWLKFPDQFRNFLAIVLLLAAASEKHGVL